MTVALAWLAVLVAVAAMARSSATRSGSGVVTAAVTCGAMALTVPGDDPGPLGDVLLLAAGVLAAAGFVLATRGAPCRGLPARGVADSAMPPGFMAIIRIGIALDVLVFADAIGLTVTQSLVLVLDDRSPWVRAAHLLPVIAACLLVAVLRTALRGRGWTATVGLGLVSAAGLLAFTVQDAARDRILPPPGSSLRVVVALVLGVTAISLYAPPVTGPRDPDPPDRRPPSRHVLGLGPPCLLPPLLWLATRQAGTPAIPTWVFLTATLAAALLLFARTVVALRSAEWIIEYDVPTQVLSMVGMSRAIRERVRRPGQGPLSLCMVALDDFKGVNDTLGGTRANTVLALVARRLTTRLGDRATVGRLGGDRFLVLIPDHPQAGREALDVFAEPFAVDDRTIRLTASVGVAPVAPGAEVDGLLGMADLAMQAAKAQGRATVVRYRRELHEQLHSPHRMVRELRDLLDGAPPERVGRIVVVYQPIAELSSSRIVGCEALVRWWHPERRLILPDRFLPAAEQGALMPRLDGLVLDRALGGLARWDAEGLDPITLSVNLGLGSMTDPDLLRWVRTSVQAHGIAFDRVRLEITEHSELPDDNVVTGSLRSLADLGIRLSLDDFGAGYTSLNYLCRYPVDLVKIDRSIILAEGDRERSPLLEGIVGLASGLCIDVLAEGIETEAQRQRLARVGIGQGQGYLFARPLEAGLLADVMRRRAAGGPGPGAGPGLGPRPERSPARTGDHDRSARA